MRENGGYVYIMTNKPFGRHYVGVTADIIARVTAHRERRGSAHCKRWNLDKLVYFERFEDIREAIAREKAMKKWLRLWKLRMISEHNPKWDDLFLTLNGRVRPPAAPAFAGATESSNPQQLQKS
ncbi:MAG: GIY-YIG nuclease family protein [Sphingorhabdus sp.]